MSNIQNPSAEGHAVDLPRLVSRSATVRARRIEILRAMEGRAAVTPMEIGASDASHHSGDLSAMAKTRLVEKIPRYVGFRQVLGIHGSYRYKITELGKAAIAAANA